MARESPSTNASALQIPELQNFSLHVTVYISPSNVTSFFSYFDPIFDLVTAEPELVYFEVFEDPESPGTIRWIENWNQTTQWFTEVQLSKDYYKEYLEKTEPMFIKPREVQFWNRLKGRYVVQKPGNVD